MKLKECLYLLGIKPSPKYYNYEIKKESMESVGEFYYARWLHPKEKEKEFTEGMIEELRKFVRPGDLCVDIGAHTGDTTLPMAMAVGKEGKVLAFEPNKFVFPSLNASALLNRGKFNIIPIMAAAADNDGELEFEYSDPGYCNGGLHEDISKWKHGHAFLLKVLGVDIASMLINDYANDIERLKFIKVDTEGYDLYILRSLKDIIEKYKPYIKAEIFKHTSDEYRLGVYELLSGLGYSIHKVVDDENLVGEKLDSNDLQKWKHYDIFAVP